MAEIVPDVRTRAIVFTDIKAVEYFYSIAYCPDDYAHIIYNDTNFSIETVSSHSKYGAEGTVPDIDDAYVLQRPSQIDGVDGKEGELILALQNGSNGWLNKDGELVIEVNEETDDVNRYEIDHPKGNLIYTQGAQTTPEDNVLSEDGDVLMVYVNALIRGKVTMNSFSDIISGDGEVEREFRVNIDSIFYTDWEPLTDENLAKRTFESSSVLKIEVRYKRISGTGDLVFHRLDISGLWEAIVFDAPTLMSSLFASLVSSPELKKIDDNIFKKLYFRGVVPKYITRAENRSYDEDRDYITLFSTVSYFYSLLIAFFKRFENFRNDEELLREQVRGLGIQFNEGSVTLEQLQYLAANYYSQIQQRGTEMISTRQGELLPNGQEAVLDGELVRLLHSSKFNELLIGSIANSKMGWCVGNSSPMYRGTCREVTLNKTPEDTEDFQSLDNFPIAMTGGASVEIATASDKKVLRISIDSAGTAGIGRLINSSANIDNYLITADPEISYEVTFAFRLVSGTASNIQLYFGVEGFNDNKIKFDDAFVNLDGAIDDGRIFYQAFYQKIDETRYFIWKSGTWYFARGIIHSYNTVYAPNEKTNLGIGADIAFNNSFVRYISPRILVSATSSAVIELWDYKIRPLVRGKSILPYKNGDLANSHSLGFIQVCNFMYTYARNNNNSFSQEEITNIIERYLYPYQKIDMFVFTGTK